MTGVVGRSVGIFAFLVRRPKRGANTEADRQRGKKTKLDGLIRTINKILSAFSQQAAKVDDRKV
jgi:hypothetical protein